ncbi:MAG: Hsp20/alpha crystallin family protein [Candidatus Nanoarchaeia archaeon]
MIGNFRSDREEMIDELSSDYRKAFTNFKEGKNEFVIQVELPGVNREDINLDVTDTGIEIKAEKKTRAKKEGEYTKQYAGFYQAFDVPENADLENIDATYRNGVLTITLPKIAKKNKKTIQIK